MEQMKIFGIKYINNLSEKIIRNTVTHLENDMLK